MRGELVMRCQDSELGGVCGGGRLGDVMLTIGGWVGKGVSGMGVVLLDRTALEARAMMCMGRAIVFDF